MKKSKIKDLKEKRIKQRFGIEVPELYDNLGYKLYDQNKNYICDVESSYQYYYLRIQIKEEQLIKRGEYFYLGKDNDYIAIDYWGRLNIDDRRRLKFIDAFGEMLDRLM